MGRRRRRSAPAAAPTARDAWPIARARRPHRAIYLAYLDGEPVGFGRAVFAPAAGSCWAARRCPTARGRGVYTSLVHARWDAGGRARRPAARGQRRARCRRRSSSGSASSRSARPAAARPACRISGAWRPSRTNTALGQQIVEDAKRLRPLLVVGAGRDQPDRGRGRRGPLLLGLRRQALPRLRLAARQRLDRLRPPEGGRGDQGAGRDSSRRSGRRWRPSRARGSGSCWPRSRPATSRCRSSRTAAPRRTRTRSSSRAGTRAATRSSRATAATTARPAGAITLTGDPRRWPAEPGHPRRRADARPVHLSLPGRPPRPVPGLHRRAAPRGDPACTRARTRSPP